MSESQTLKVANLALLLQRQIDRMMRYFRDNQGEVELLAESDDPLLKTMAGFISALMLAPDVVIAIQPSAARPGGGAMPEHPHIDHQSVDGE